MFKGFLESTLECFLMSIWQDIFVALILNAKVLIMNKQITVQKTEKTPIGRNAENVCENAVKNKVMLFNMINIFAVCHLGSIVILASLIQSSHT